MRVLLNGVGRIGKAILRIANSTEKFEIVAINEINSNVKNIAYSINYDSTYGQFDDKFKVNGKYLENSISKIKVLNKKDILNIDFEKLNIDIVIDASGSKVDIKKLKELPLKALFLTHPNKDADINVILGVNEQNIDIKKDKIISTSSCNATALLPVLKIIEENFKIKYGNITTIHPLLNHQKVLDSNCIGSSNRGIDCNFEFGRSSVQNIIPSKTTTIDACSYVMNCIGSKKISSNSFRVPTATVGAIDISLVVKQSCSKNALIELFEKNSKKQTDKVLLNSYDSMVSSDFQGENFTTIVDHRFTDVKKNKMIKLNVWYDNEWGYASKVVDIVDLYKKKLNIKDFK
ncbi:MAG: glyceraldehyde 3-phosphate dehydrogenase NAD-binding domain-containing protein [Campylobacterota bacterium]|nr:glyceraldehyde 3-phosphate dehydrogenase NAD-binding domain-containing protein [Campylobacterota bacterium]